VNLTRDLAAFCYKLKYDDLPDQVVEKVKVCTLHGVAVGLAAVERPTAKQALSFAKKLYTQRNARTRLLADGTRVSIAGVTFANSVLFHSRLQEDDYHDGLIHLGVIVLPAALASAEQNRKSGSDFITAVASGYEIGARISRVYAHLSIPRGFRSTPVYGPVAAAASSAKLLGLNEQQTLSALGWGANSGGGLLECGVVQNISEMPFQAGFACSSGVMSALLAQEGAVAAPSLLEGERGFLRAFAGTNEETEKVTKGLGKHYHMLETFFKPYPIGGLLQAPVAAMLGLVAENNVAPSQIREAELRMSPVEALYPGANSMKPGPMSLQFCVAMAACERKITTAAIDGIVNPCISDLMKKIKITPDESVAPLRCKLIVTTSNQGILKKDLEIGINNFKEETKLVESLIPEMKISKQKVAKAVKMIESLEACEDITQLIDLLISK
jgi:2-methylcitrate dehydratase PrpD